MASVRWREDRNSWEVVWKELSVTADADGVETRAWKTRRRGVPDKRTGEALARDVESKAALGQAWTDEREQAVSTMGAIAEAYVRASRKGRPEATANGRASTLQRFLAWVGDARPVTDLSMTLLGDYATHLQDTGLSSVPEYVSQVERLWAWAHDQEHAGVPTPKRITGADRDMPFKPRPVAMDNPTWADVDAMLRALTPAGAPGGGQGYGYRPQWEVYRRIGVVQRYTGLRISQVCGLRWVDLDLDRLRLTIRAARRGAKGQGRDRVVPLHPALAAEMAGWGVREGLVFSRVATKGARKGEPTPIPGNEVAEVFSGSDHKAPRGPNKGQRVHTPGAWERAGVDVAKWGVGEDDDREHGRGTNAIRARFKSHIAGVASYELATLMVGQSSRGEHDAYVAMGNPEASPYWATMVRALGTIPAIGEAKDNVVYIRASERTLR